MKPTWGITSTIKAPAADILRFAAYHLEAGADRINIYLDDDNPAAFAPLDAHPRIHVIACDAAYWKRRKKHPEKHQHRQTANATHAYRRSKDVDWLIHMDGDEFLVSSEPIADILATVPPEAPVTRIRPMESLSGDAGTAFKAFIPGGPERSVLLAKLYPTYGGFLKGGFLSHLAGKVFTRTGKENIRVRIHNVMQDGEALMGVENQPGIDLAHLHAKDWEHWLSTYRYRLTSGSYRPELGPNKPYEKGGLSMHDLFSVIEKEGGEAGLWAFFQEVCADTPHLRAKLRTHGLLREVNLNLERALSTHFPDVAL